MSSLPRGTVVQCVFILFNLICSFGEPVNASGV